VAGTHGKTSTASMIAWILDYAGMAPGFLIGGVPINFGISARLGDSPFFVIEADEYDTAFFDKRSKFVHYHPRTLVLNNLEYDHADIFADLAAIETQFHHLVRILPSSGLVIANADSDALKRVLDRGCWTPVETFGQTGDWQVAGVDPVSSRFDVVLKGQFQGSLEWSLLGEHNRTNALAAIAAARHVGVPVEVSLAALTEFKGVARRMELRGEVGDIRVYDDFAHHPTAIASTVAGLKNRYPDRRLMAVLDLRSNTMRMGVHREALRQSFEGADAVFIYAPADLSWNPAETLASMAKPLTVCHTLDGLLAALLETLRAGDQVLVMSNGAFGGLHQRLLDALVQRSESV